MIVITSASTLDSLDVNLNLAAIDLLDSPTKLCQHYSAFLKLSTDVMLAKQAKAAEQAREAQVAAEQAEADAESALDADVALEQGVYVVDSAANDDSLGWDGASATAPPEADIGPIALQDSSPSRGMNEEIAGGAATQRAMKKPEPTTG